MTSEISRHREIDLFRAIAIVMVLGFHYLSRWTPPRFETNLYPYSGTFAENALFSNGYLGVDFFFIISGFVIALTLHRCNDIFEFLVRRAARLLPAMIFCSLVTLVFVKAFVPVQYFRDEANVWNILPSWTFTEPRMWSRVSPVSSHIDGAYWSLVVEMKFYIWAACIYFLNKENFLRNIFIFCALTSIAYIVGEAFQIKPLQTLEFYVLFGHYAMLFMAGILFQQIKTRPADLRKLWPYLAVCLATELVAASIIGERLHFAPAAIKVSFFIAFLAFAMGWQVKKSAPVDFVIRVGLASYPLYLLHQNIGVGILSLGRGMESAAAVISLFIAVCAVMIYASFLVQQLVERPGKKLILSRLLHRYRGSSYKMAETER